MGEGYAAIYQLVMVIASMCLAAVILLGVAEIPSLVRRRSIALWLGGLFALALLARATLPPAGLFHDHNHGYQYLEVMLGSGPHQYRLEYGLGGFGVFRFLLFFLPHRPDSVFALNIFLGALTVVPVFAFARMVWESERAGLFAALAIAVLPPHVRLSATEDLYVLAGLLEATCLAALVAYWRSGSKRHLALTVASAVLVCQVRETMNLLPLLAIVGSFAFGPPVRVQLRSRQLWIAAGAAVALVAPHAYFFATYSLPSLAAIGPRFDAVWVIDTGVRLLTGENPYLDPSVTLPGFALLAVAGVALGFRAEARRILFVVAAVLVFAWVASLKTITETDRIMFHAHYGVLLAVLVGRGASRLADYSRGRRAQTLVLVGITAVLLSLPLGARSFLERKSNIQREFACVSEHAKKVGAGCTLVTLTNGEDVGDEPIGVGFGYLPQFGPSHLSSISAFLARAQAGGVGLNAECHVYYEQRICYEPSFDEVLAFCGLSRGQFRYPELLACVKRYRGARTDAYQLLCARAHEELALEPLGTCQFDAAPLDVDPMPPGRPLEIGFYRISGMRAADPHTPQQLAEDPNQ